MGLRLRLAPDRPAIGATATVFLPDGRRTTAQVDGGNGHSGKRSQDIHFGLGSVPAQSPLRVAIRWRDAAGIHERSERLLPGWHTVRLTEAPAKLEGGQSWLRPPFRRPSRLESRLRPRLAAPQVGFSAAGGQS
jgi:hypothetical protein